MIAKDFDYYCPGTVDEAVRLFISLKKKGEQPLYYAGGSEIITMCRAGTIAPDAVIDLKAIEALSQVNSAKDKLTIGANVTLSAIQEQNICPMLGLAASRIADHTNQVRITLGGNVCGTIMYREMVLALLVCEANVLLHGKNGERCVAMTVAFDGRMQRGEEEIVCGFELDRHLTDVPFVHVKKTSGEKIGYPLITVVASKIGEKLRLAVSGLCDFPFRSEQMERIINEREVTPRLRAERMLGQAPAGILSDVTASDMFRRKVFIDVVSELIETLEEAKA